MSKVMHGCQWTDHNVWEGGVCTWEGLRVCRSWSATVMYHSCHGQGCKGCMCGSQCYITMKTVPRNSDDNDIIVSSSSRASLTVSYIPNIHNVQERSTTKGIASLSLQRLHNTVACKAEWLKCACKVLWKVCLVLWGWVQSFQMITQVNKLHFHDTATLHHNLPSNMHYQP